MWDGHLWSPSYYFVTAGNMSKDTVEKYINDSVYNAGKDGKPYPSPYFNMGMERAVFIKYCLTYIKNFL